MGLWLCVWGYSVWVHVCWCVRGVCVVCGCVRGVCGVGMCV